MTDSGQRPIDILAGAVKAAGGVVAVAKRIETSVTHLSNVVTGTRPLGRETAQRLRPILGESVPAKVWVDLLAPLPLPDAVETTPAGDVA